MTGYTLLRLISTSVHLPNFGAMMMAKKICFYWTILFLFDWFFALCDFGLGWLVTLLFKICRFKEFWADTFMLCWEKIYCITIFDFLIFFFAAGKKIKKENVLKLNFSNTIYVYFYVWIIQVCLLMNTIDLIYTVLH